MQLENQFITPEELVSIHLQELLSRPTLHLKTASQAQSSILTKVINQVQEGSCPISQNSKNTEELLESLTLSESQKRLQANRKKKQERSNLNQLLYGNNKNKIKEYSNSVSQRLLSIVEHHQFIKNMREDNEKRQKKREQRQYRQTSLRQAKEEVQKRLSQDDRMASIERRKQDIKQNLIKMRENHEKMIASEFQSRKLYSTIRKKKRLYQQMKQLQDQKALQQHQQMAKRLKKKIEESKLDFTALHLHEKQYLQLKNQSKSRQKYKSPDHNSQNPYHPPPHSKKLTKFLEEELKMRNKFDIDKKKLQDKLQKISEYKSLLKEKYKIKSPLVSKTLPSDRQKSSASEYASQQQHINRIHLGNEYLKQAKLQSRKRAKTQQKYFKPQTSGTVQVRLKPPRQKNKTDTLEYIPESKRQKYIQRMKRQEIQKIINGEEMSSRDRLQSLKIADQRISKQLRKKEAKLQVRYSTQASQNTLNLLLGSIKAKINLMNALIK